MEYLRNPETYTNFVTKSKAFARDLNALINGTPVIGYGASAKGMNIIQLTGITPRFIIDETPTKQNKYTPARNIPVCAPDRLQAVTEDVLIIPLAWNFFDEIKSKVKSLRPNNIDKFVRYFPELKIEV